MKISVEWLDEKSACGEGVKWFTNKYKKPADGILVVKDLEKDNKFNWANWLIVRLMTHKQQIKYAVFAAEQVIGIYEKKYPDDKRPRNAIEAAKKYLKKPNNVNKNAAGAAYAAAYAAGAAYAAAHAAAYAADAAAYAADAAADAKKELRRKIVAYGIKIIKEMK